MPPSLPAHRLFSLLSALFLFAATALASEEEVKVWHEEFDGGYSFHAENKSPAPHSLQVKFSTLQNLEPTVALPLQIVLAGNARTPLFDIRIANRARSHRFDYHYDYVIGDFREARHDDTHAYWLPFEHGAKFRLAQGYHGLFSHSDPGEEYAVDFSMPVGTAVTAARGGTVLRVKEDSNAGGASKSYEDDGNVVVVQHDDGSFAEYIHLKKDGAVVERGDRVEAGETIGYSGNTGRSNGAHLHFHVAVPTPEGKIKTLPTRFVDHEGKPIPLKAGFHYYSFHPGKPPFQAIYGRDLTNADFAGHRKEIPTDNTVSIRDETIDGTVVFYVRNSFPVRKEFVFDLSQLENMTPSKPLPLKVTVPPSTEQYLLFVRQKDAAKAYRYRTKWEFRDVE